MGTSVYLNLLKFQNILDRSAVSMERGCNNLKASRCMLWFNYNYLCHQHWVTIYEMIGFHLPVGSVDRVGYSRNRKEMRTDNFHCRPLMLAVLYRSQYSNINISIFLLSKD